MLSGEAKRLGTNDRNEYEQLQTQQGCQTVGVNKANNWWMSTTMEEE